MIARYKNLLLERAAEWNVPRNGTWNFLFHNNYHPHCSNINLLWFHDHEEFPRVVTKIYREPEILKREFENLVQIYGDVPHLVPRPLYFGFEGNFWTLWMEGVPGLRLHLTEKFSSAVIGSAAAAVLSMHLATRRPGSVFGMDRYRRMVSEPLETVSCFGPAAHVRAGCAEVAAEISPDWINGLPTIPQHGDLFSGNLLLHHDKWRILDWETYGLIDLPLYDLLTFFLSVLLARGPVPEHWRPSLLARMPALIAAYSQSLGLSPADTRRLFPLTLANWFHLQWKDGRQEFATAMYKTIDHYFQCRELWENSILPNSFA